MKKPSVSELVALLDKPALLSWANKQGLLGVDIKKKRKEWLSAGTSIHSQIEDYIKDGKPFVSERDQELFEVFLSGKKIVSFESNIETEWFIGRYDIKMDIGGRLYLMDFKKNAKAIYFENKLQLVAYSMAEPCDKFAIVSVPTFKVMNFDIKDRKPYEETLKALSIIYTQKQLIDGECFRPADTDGLENF